MCSDCYEEDHLRGHQECKGVVRWEEYCKRFERKWEEERNKKGEKGEQRSGDKNIELEKRIKEIEKENKELREKANKKIEPDTVEKMENVIEKLQGEIESLQKIMN